MGWGLTGGLCFTGVVSLDRAALCSTTTHLCLECPGSVTHPPDMRQAYMLVLPHVWSAPMQASKVQCNQYHQIEWDCWR